MSTKKLAFFYSKTLAINVLNVIINLKRLVKTTVFFKWDLITVDYDDNKFVDCAISANARYIVTNEHHFNVLKSVVFPKVNIIKLAEYAKLMKSE